MDEERDLMTLTDEEGNEFEVELIDSVEYNGEIYYAFIPTEASIDDYYELMIMKVETVSVDESILSPVEDDEYDELYQIFCEREEEEYEDDEEDEDEE